MIKLLESGNKKLVYYFQPDTIQVNESIELNLITKEQSETIEEIIVSPLYLLNKLGVSLNLVDDYQNGQIQSNMIWPDATAKAPLGLSILLIKTLVDLPYQPQEVLMNLKYSGKAILTLCADCLETSAIITIFRGRN